MVLKLFGVEISRNKILAYFYLSFSSFLKKPPFLK